MSKEIKEPWHRLRDLEPPLGAKGRVISRAMKDIEEGRLKRKTSLAIPVFITVGALALLLLFLLPNSSEEPLWVLHAVSDAGFVQSEILPKQSETHFDACPENAVTSITVAADDKLSIENTQARFLVQGPSTIESLQDGIRVYSGRVDIAGYTFVQGPDCEVQIDGRAQVTVVGEVLEVLVEQGKVKSLQGARCHIENIELDVVNTQATNTKTIKFNVANSKKKTTMPLGEPLEKQEEPTLSQDNAIAVQENLLSQQLTRYKEAKFMVRTRPKQALLLFQRFKEDFPASPLIEEVEASMVRSMILLGDTKAAKKAFFRFKKRYVKSIHLNMLIRKMKENP